MGKLIPIIMLLFGVGAGIGAGVVLKPAQQAETGHSQEAAPEHASSAAEHPSPDERHGENTPENTPENAPENTGVEYVKMNNQFVVPVVDQGKVKALVVLSLNIEVEPGTKEQAFQREPKLRSAFNQVLFDHANAGGFDGVFTSANNMMVLENALFEAAYKILGDIAKSVLIADIVRQDY